MQYSNLYNIKNQFFNLIYVIWFQDELFLGKVFSNPQLNSSLHHCSVKPAPPTLSHLLNASGTALAHGPLLDVVSGLCWYNLVVSFLLSYFSILSQSFTILFILFFFFLFLVSFFLFLLLLNSCHHHQMPCHLLSPLFSTFTLQIFRGYDFQTASILLSPLGSHF